MIKITALPTICADIFDATGEIMPGGEALNFAAEAGRYPHVRIELMGVIGDDACGEKILQSVRGKNIGIGNVRVVGGGVTASNRIYNTESGDRYFKPDSWQSGVYGGYSLSEEDIEALRDTDIVFVYGLCPIFERITELKDSLGFRLAVDMDDTRDMDVLEKAAQAADYFFISGEEGMLTVFEEWSRKYGGVFNITLAERGSVTFHRGREYRVSAVPVEKVIDTTGCGDSYHAAFICSYERDRDITAAMNEGSRAAAQTLLHVGAFLY